MTGQQLRNSILQEAIHGRLVPNTLQPGELTARELLNDILAARQKAENDAKGKKAKKLTLSKIEEEPWELPEGWCWCRIEDIAEFELGKTKDTEKNKGELKPYLCTINVRENGIDLSVLKEMRFNELDCEHYRLQKGDLMICEGGDCGRSAVWEYDDKEMYYQNALHRVRLCKGFSSHYFNYIFQLYKEIGLTNGRGVGIKHFTQTIMKSLYFPLPPLSIQHSIVSKIEALLPLVEAYDAAQGELKALNESLPDKLRKSVLQEAIHGRLVPNTLQPGELTARELLNDILAARQKTENETKGKKAKKLTLNKIEEEPWELPEGWCWCRLGDIGEILTGSTPSKDNPQFYGKDYPFFKPTDLEQGINVCEAREFLSEKGFAHSRQLPPSSVLVTCIGATIGKVGIIRKQGSCNQQINVIIPSDRVCSEYLYHCINSTFFQNEIKSNASATTLPILNKSGFSCLLLPLPPLSIQHEIVSKIEEIFAILDSF